MIVFTICARNFLAQALTLYASLRRNHFPLRFYVALCDSDKDLDVAAYPFEILPLTCFGIPNLEEMSGRYNITELNTSIKPFVFSYLFDEHPDAVITYLDPDIYVCESFTELLAEIDGGADCILTPHITEPAEFAEMTDKRLLRFGVYNLGFCALRDTPVVRRVVGWWGRRLEMDCVINLSEGLFVDQKWADLFPAYIEKTKILRHPGYNVAYWNLSQRTVQKSNDKWFVNNENLRFVHFSGSRIEPRVFSRHSAQFTLANIRDLGDLFDEYCTQVKRHGFAYYSSIPYEFSWGGVSGVNEHTPSPGNVPTAQGHRRQGAVLPEDPVPYLPVIRAHTLAEYEDTRGNLLSAIQLRRSVEEHLVPFGQETFEIGGHCVVCGFDSRFRVSSMYAGGRHPDGRFAPNWREHLDCVVCGHQNRIRATLHILEQEIRPASIWKIYLTERVTPLFRWFDEKFSDVTGSEYLGANIRSGTTIDGVRHEDIQALSFANGTFDLIVSLDVLEHVPEPAKALRELRRCLRPGGVLLLSAPFIELQYEHEVRALLGSDGSINHLMEPEYHGNPVDPEKGALCFNYFGWRLLDDLQVAGFEHPEALFWWSRDHAYLGANNSIVLAQVPLAHQALTETWSSGKRKIIVVTHDGNRSGAQYLALNLAREFCHTLGYQVHLVALGAGPLLTEYARIGPLTVLEGEQQDGDRAHQIAAELASQGYQDAIVNSVASGLFATALQMAGIRVVSLVHELPEIISRYDIEPHLFAMAAAARYVVFPAKMVVTGFQSFRQLDRGQIVICPQGLYKRNAISTPEAQQAARLALRQRFDLLPEAEIIIGVGWADHRKGIDLFVEVARETIRIRPQAAFIWVGDFDASVDEDIKKWAADPGCHSRLFFPGHQSATDLFYAGADLYAMTSREDPFPSVILESLDVGVPVVGFDGTGGFAELAVHGCVRLAPAFDVAAFAGELVNLLADPIQRHAAGEAGRKLIADQFSFRRYVFDLLQLTRHAPPRVSVIVPNFNYLRYMSERIRSILAQDVPIYELIIMDDASTDGSQEWLRSELPGMFDTACLVFNEANSGSVSMQWLNGVRRARGDLIWIAEADDSAEPQFLAEALSGFTDPEVVLSYTQSKQIDDEGQILADHYLDYVADISLDHWRKPYLENGIDEIRLRLAVKNTIPNVSAAVFRREPLLHALESQRDDIRQYRNAGDWFTYIHVLRQGKIAFSPCPVNLHRRHAASVTISGLDERQLNEIVQVQQYVRMHFDVPDAVVATADAYAESLRLWFGTLSGQPS